MINNIKEQAHVLSKYSRTFCIAGFAVAG